MLVKCESPAVMTGSDPRLFFFRKARGIGMGIWRMVKVVRREYAERKKCVGGTEH